jgi:hypothetical protein
MRPDAKYPDEGARPDSIFSTICPNLASGIKRAFPPILIKVFKLRVRTLIASYIEEWNNYKPVSKTEPGEWPLELSFFEQRY